MKLSDKFVKSYINSNRLSIHEKDEDRPWGAYYIIEIGDQHDKKILKVKPRQLLSLQFHGHSEHPGHDEHITCLTKFAMVKADEVVIGLSTEQVQKAVNRVKPYFYQPGDVDSTKAGTLHAYVNPYHHDIYIIEERVSPFLELPHEREANITRVHDQTGRDGATAYPEDLLKKIFIFDKLTNQQ